MNFFVELKIRENPMDMRELEEGCVGCLFSNTGSRVDDTLLWTEGTIRSFITSKAFLEGYAFTSAIKDIFHWSIASEFTLSTRYQNVVSRLHQSDNIEVHPLLDGNGIMELSRLPEIVVSYDKMMLYIPKAIPGPMGQATNPNAYPIPVFNTNSARVDVVPPKGHLLYSKLTQGNAIINFINAYSNYGLGFKQTFLCTSMNLEDYIEWLKPFDLISIVYYSTVGINEMRNMLRNIFENKRENTKVNIFYMEDDVTLYNINLMEESIAFHRFVS